MIKHYVPNSVENFDGVDRRHGLSVHRHYKDSLGTWRIKYDPGDR